MIIEAIKLHNVFRFGETDNEIVFDDLFGEDQGGIALIVGSVDGDENSSNGAGKSSIIEGLYWCLYEKMPRLIRNSERKGTAAAKVIKTNPDGSYAGSEAYVQIRLRMADGVRWRIKRGRKITKSGSHSPILEIEKGDGESMSALTKQDPEETIKELIGIDHESFLNSLLFAQKDSGKFLCGSDSNRRDILMNLLSLQLVDKMLELLRNSDKKEVKKSIENLEAKIEVLKSRVDGQSGPELRRKKMDLAAEIQAIDKAAAEVDKQIAELDNAPEHQVLDQARKKAQEAREGQQKAEHEKSEAMTSVKHDLENAENALSQARARVERVEKQKNKINEKFQNASKLAESHSKEELQEWKARIEGAREEEKRLNEKKAEIEEKLRKLAGDKGGAEISLRLRREEVELWESLSEKGSKCPTCGAEWDPQELAAKIAAGRAEIAGLEKSANGLAEEEERAGAEQGRVVIELSAAKAVLNEEMALAAAVHKIRTAKDAIAECKEEAGPVKIESVEAAEAVKTQEGAVEKAKAAVREVEKKFEGQLLEAADALKTAKLEEETAAEKVGKLNGRRGELRKKLTSETGRKAELSSEIGGIDAKLVSLQRDTDELAGFEADLEVEKQRQLRISYLEGLLSGDVKTEAAEACLPLLNFYSNDFLLTLHHGLTMQVESDGSKMPIKMQGDVSPTYDMLSGGEQEAVRLSVDMALSMISIGGSTELPDMIFLDEIFGSLDTNTKENVFLLLDRLRSHFNRILVITHDPLLRERFSPVIHVDKKHGTSKISYTKKEQG